MSARTQTLARLVGVVATALDPLAAELADPEAALGLLSSAGVELSTVPACVLDLAPHAEAVRDDLRALGDAGDDGELAAALRLAASVAELGAALAQLGPRLVDELGEAPEQPARADAGRRLMDALLLDAIGRTRPRVDGALRLAGIFETHDEPGLDAEPAGGDPGYDPYGGWDGLSRQGNPDEYARVVPDWGEPGSDIPRRRGGAVRMDRVATLLGGVTGLAQDVYGWGADFRADDALGALGLLARRLGVPVLTRAPDGTATLPLFTAAATDGTVDVGAVLEPLPATGDDASDAGVGVAPHAEGAATLAFRVTDAVTLELTGDFDLSGATRVELRPGAVRIDGDGDSLTAALRVAPPGGIPLLVQSGLVSVTAESLALTLGLESADGGAAPIAGAALTRVTAELSGDQGDSFLQALLPSAAATFDIGLEWTGDGGLRLGGGAELELHLPLGVEIAGVVVEALDIALALTPAPELSMRATARLALGPLLVRIAGAGLAVALTFPDSRDGNLGYADLALSFVPPTGAGFEVDVAGVVKGGAFLDFDPAAGRYAGVGELDVLGVGLVATGVIAVSLPSGFSMFVSLAARFTGIPLGFGFTLNGAGGLVGIDRGVDEDALGEAARSGALDAVLFPEDPIAQAPEILAGINAIFPPRAGQYVFGPMVKLGWGTPTLVELDAALVIQLPEPLTVSLLGALRALLPEPDVPILELHVNFAATVNLTEGTLKLDASLTGSQVAGLPITGDMAVRAAFLDAPSFLVAFGGFHPAYDPPEDFPELERVSVSLDTGDALRIGLGGYFAITSNSVQTGARADLWAGAEGFTLEGGTSFNAILQWDPFYFSVALRMWVSVTAAGTELLGVLLKGKLSGPNPWTVSGKAEFRLLGLATGFDFDEAFGELDGERPPEQADPSQLVRDALAADDAWSGLPPLGPVPVAVADDDAVALAVHPSGRVQALQRLVPLDLELERYGTAEVTGAATVSVRADGFAAADVEDALDWFAGAQYFALSEDEQLSAPSFELMKAGLVLGGTGADAPDPATAVFDHEIAYCDPIGRPAAPDPARPYSATDAVLARAVGARADAPPPRYAVAQSSWIVADPLTGATTGAGAAGGMGFFAARGARTARPTVLMPAHEAELIA